MISYFVIFWGTHHRRIPRGVVAEVCPRCRRITPFVVIDHFAQPHVYGIGYAAGIYHGATRDCRHCRLSFAFAENDYDDVAAMSSMTEPEAFDRVVRTTNVRLATMIAIGNRLRAVAKDPPYRTPSGESVELLPEALSLLEQLMLGGHDVRAFFRRLDEWEGMTEEQRKELVGALRGVSWVGPPPTALNY